jgi:hypothetical protein
MNYRIKQKMKRKKTKNKTHFKCEYCEKKVKKGIWNWINHDCTGNKVKNYPGKITFFILNHDELS